MIRTEIQTEVLVIGAGPAGIAAATAAAEQGCEVVVLDDNAAPGGQTWRAGIAQASTSEAGAEDAPRHRALARLARSGAKILGSHRVFNALASSPAFVTDQALGTIEAVRQDRAGSTVVRFAYKHAILATGARERFLPFPGWTLPGVFGAGGLQALVKGGFSVQGKRVLVAGTGPLLLAVAAHLKTYGAIVVGVAEQAGMSQLIPFGASLWSHPGKLLQGLRYRMSLRGVPYRTGCWPVAAAGTGKGISIRSATLSNGTRTWNEPCDLLACGFHLVPNTELASLLGCEFSAAFVKVDSQQRTSLPGVFCVGEPTGIAGLEAALLQGELAGLTCAGKSTGALEKRAAAQHAFALRLEKAFALRPELLKLAAPDTIVCRCEDVPLNRLIGHTGWTDAKLQTRCGMGPCQGRICGAAIEALFGWKPLSVRQPLFPVSLGALCSNEEEPYLSDLLEENA